MFQLPSQGRKGANHLIESDDKIILGTPPPGPLQIWWTVKLLYIGNFSTVFISHTKSMCVCVCIYIYIYNVAKWAAWNGTNNYERLAFLLMQSSDLPAAAGAVRCGGMVLLLSILASVCLNF